MSIFLAFLYTAIGMGLVYSGVAFINGQLLPQNLSEVYALLSNYWLRLLVALAPFFGAANHFVGLAYKNSGPGWAGSGLVTATVVGMVIVAMILDSQRLNWEIGLGTVVALGGCLLVVHGLSQ